MGNESSYCFALVTKKGLRRNYKGSSWFNSNR